LPAYQAFLRQQEQQRQQFLQSQQLVGGNFTGDYAALPPLGVGNTVTNPELEFDPFPEIAVQTQCAQAASARQPFRQQPSDFSQDLQGTNPIAQHKTPNPPKNLAKTSRPSSKGPKKKTKSRPTEEIFVDREDDFADFRQERESLRQSFSPNSISDSQSTSSDSQSQQTNSSMSRTSSSNSSSAKRKAAKGSSTNPKQKKKRRNDKPSKPSTEDLEAKVAMLEAQLSSVSDDKAKIANLEAQLSLVNGKKAVSNGQIRTVSTATTNMMTEAFKACIYPDTQLVNNNEQGKEVMMRVFDLIKDQLKLVDTNAERDSFYLTYLKTFKTMLTTVRNNTQQEVKKAASWWLDQKGPGHDTLPDDDMIFKCAKRDIDLNDPYQASVMELYWRKLLAVLSKDWKEDKQLSRLAVNFAVKTEFTEDPVLVFHHRAEGKLSYFWITCCSLGKSWLSF
jgi:hypothetical protein